MAYRLSFLCLLLASCTFIRENNETYFYRSTIRSIDYSITPRTKAVCGGMNYKVRRPRFIKNASLTPYMGVTYPKTIEYRSLGIIPHETVHYLIMENRFSRECLEEMLADITGQLVRERKNQ